MRRRSRSLLVIPMRWPGMAMLANDETLGWTAGCLLALVASRWLPTLKMMEERGAFDASRRTARGGRGKPRLDHLLPINHLVTQLLFYNEHIISISKFKVYYIYSSSSPRNSYYCKPFCFHTFSIVSFSNPSKLTNNLIVQKGTI